MDLQNVVKMVVGFFVFLIFIRVMVIIAEHIGRELGVSDKIIKFMGKLRKFYKKL